MQSSVENVGAIGRKLSVVVPADKIEEAVQVKLRQLVKRVKIQGFRQGKVPLKIVDQQYRGSATNEVLGDLIQSSLQEALTEQKLVPAVQPDVLPEQLEKGEDFTYVASFDVYPEFQKLNLAGVKIVKPESEVIDTDIDTVIENMRKQQLTWKEVERKGKIGDRLMIDFVGTIDGEEFAGGKAEDYPIVLGEGEMLPDFEKGVAGMKAGDSQSIDVHFPDDYSEEMGGKDAVFAIEVKSVSETELPAIDQEFVKAFGIESGETDDMRTQVRENLETNLETQLSTTLRQRAFDALLEQNQTDMPLKMVQEEAQRMVQEQKNQMLQQGIDAKVLEDFPDPEFENLKPQAERRVALGLLMMEIIRTKNLKPDDKKVADRIEKMASSYEEPQEFIDYYNNDQQALSQVRSIVLEEQVVEMLLEEAEVETEQLVAVEFLKVQR